MITLHPRDLTVNGTRTDVVYGAGRAHTVTGGTRADFSQSVLGDTVDGDVTVSAGFDPYGNPDTEKLTVGFGYRGELHVAGLVYLRARNYDPTLGRFLTPDPLDGVPGTTTITNQYTYANNNPITSTDPTGLRAGDDLFRLLQASAGLRGFGADFGFSRLGVIAAALDDAGFTEEELDTITGEAAVVTLEVVDAAGQTVTVTVDVVYIRNSDTYLMKLPNGRFESVRATASMDAQILSGSRIWGNDAPAFLKRLDPNNLGRIAKGAGVLGFIAEVTFVTVEAIEGYRAGGADVLFDIAAKGAAEIGGGIAGFAAFAKALENVPYPFVRVFGSVFGAFLGSEVGERLFDALAQGQDCPSPLFYEYWTNPQSWRPECGGTPPPGWAPAA